MSELGFRVIWLRALEVSRPKMSYGSPLDTFRIVTAYYGWGREKDHPCGESNLKTDYDKLSLGYY